MVDRLRMIFQKLRRRVRPQAGDQHPAVGSHHPPGDRLQVLRPFPLGVDRFGEAVAELAVEVELGEVEVGVGELGEIAQGLVRRAIPGGHRFEQAFEVVGIHDGRAPRSAPPLRYPLES